MVASLAAFVSGAPSGHVERVDGAVLVATGLPLRLFNQVIAASDGADPRGIARAVAIARERGYRFAVNLRRGADDRLVPFVSELGLVAHPDNPWMPGMALHPLPPAGARVPAPGHEIRRVADPSGLADHIRTGALGFEMPEEWLAVVVNEDLADRTDVGVYVGYADGAPVTTGLAVRTGTTLGIYNIATVEGARRRGFGADMTARLVEDGRAAGCDVAILQASPMGRPVYERLGFRTVVEYDAWIDPEPAA